MAVRIRANGYAAYAGGRHRIRKSDLRCLQGAYIAEPLAPCKQQTAVEDRSNHLIFRDVVPGPFHEPCYPARSMAYPLYGLDRAREPVRSGEDLLVVENEPKPVRAAAELLDFKCGSIVGS